MAKPANSTSPSKTERNHMPQLTGTSPYLAKDQAKSDRANKFIGRGSSRSSTHRYMLAWGNLANCQTYTKNDIVFVSAEGNRIQRVSPPWVTIKAATDAGAVIITDGPADRNRTYNIGEREVAEFLTKERYEESKPGTWTPMDPLDFWPCESCGTMTANNQLTACIFRDENEEPDTLDLCPHCKDKYGK